MADGGNSAEFTVRLVNQVMAPARQIKAAMGDVEKAFKSAQRTMAAPTPRRGATSDWDRMLAGAKRSQTADFAKQNIAAIRQQTRALKEQEAEHHAIRESMNHIVGGAAMGGMVAFAAAGYATAAAVGYVAYRFGEASVQAAMFAQTSRLAMSFLIGNAATAAVQFDSVRKEAQQLGLDVENTQHSFQKLLAAQFSIGKSRELIRMGSDLQAIGASADDVAGALLAITQIKSKGRLQAQEMLQLQERGISSELVYGALQRRLGKTKDQVQALQQKGKIGGDDAIEAILEAVRHKTGTTFAGQAGANFANNTITGMIGQGRAALSNFFIDVGDAILPGITNIAGKIKDVVTLIANDPKVAELGTFLLNRFEYFTLWLDANWPRISGLLVDGARFMVDAIRFVVDAFDEGTTQGKVFHGLLVGLGAAFVLGAGLATAIAGAMTGLVFVLGIVPYAIYQAVTVIGQAIDWLAQKLGLLGGNVQGGGGAAGGAGASGGLSTVGQILTAPLAPMLGPLGFMAGALAGPSIPAANDNGRRIEGVTAGNAAQTLGSIQQTEAGKETGGKSVSIAGGLNVQVTAPEGSDPESFAQRISTAVHSELLKHLSEAS